MSIFNDIVQAVSDKETAARIAAQHRADQEWSDRCESNEAALYRVIEALVGKPVELDIEHERTASNNGWSRATLEGVRFFAGYAYIGGMYKTVVSIGHVCPGCEKMLYCEEYWDGVKPLSEYNLARAREALVRDIRGDLSQYRESPFCMNYDHHKCDHAVWGMVDQRTGAVAYLNAKDELEAARQALHKLNYHVTRVSKPKGGN